MRYRERLLLGFGLIIAIFSALLAYDLAALSAASARIRAIAERDFAAERAIQASAQIVLRVKAEVWDARFLDPSRRLSAIAALEEGAASFQRNLDRLRGWVPREMAVIDRLARAFQSYFVFAASYLAPDKSFEPGGTADAVVKFRANQEELMALIDECSGSVEREFEASLLGLNNGFREILLVSLLGAAAAVLGAAFVALALSRRLTRPLDELALVARAVAGGDYRVRPRLAGGAGEAAILATAFDSMLDRIARYQEGLEEEVRIRTEELARSNDNLVAINGKLEAAYAELKEAQERLVATEKKALVGRMVSGIAHELNTPLAAIISSSRTTSEDLEAILSELPAAYAGASEAEISLYRACLEGVRAGREPFDTREERARRRRIREDLLQAGREDAELWAELLAGMGFTELPAAAAVLLGTERGLRLLELAAKAAAVARSSCIAEQAAAQAARVVETLRSFARQESRREDAPIELRAQLEEALASPHPEEEPR